MILRLTCATLTWLRLASSAMLLARPDAFLDLRAIFGGQRQRVAIARALERKILVYDEQFSALCDIRGQAGMRRKKVLTALHVKSGCTAENIIADAPLPSYAVSVIILPLSDTENQNCKLPEAQDNIAFIA